MGVAVSQVNGIDCSQRDGKTDEGWSPEPQSPQWCTCSGIGWEEMSDTDLITENAARFWCRGGEVIRGH
jgi:hypothetical protein